jgi:UDP-glucuronate 4-epimerase
VKILVTGAAGFIGSNLSEYLLNKEYEVVGIDNFNDYYNPKIKEYHIRGFKDHENFKLYRKDILDTTLLEELFSLEGIEVVVHLAAWAGVTTSIELPEVYVRNNEEGTVNLAQMAVKHGAKNFIFASTSSIYGDNPTPFVEHMNTDHPLAPYPATKKGSEVMLSTYNRNLGLKVTIFRIFNPIGPRLRPDLAIPKLIRSCLYGDEFPQYWEDPGKTGRDYTYVNHMMDVTDFAINHPFEYEIFNLGNSQPVSLSDLIKTVEHVVGKAANIKVMPARKGEMITTFANVDKAKKMLGYNPYTTLEEMVRFYFDWFNQQEEWYKRGEF